MTASATTLGVASIGTTAIAGTPVYGDVTVTVTTPDTSTWVSSTVTATWTYANSLSSPQTHWRVRLTTQSGTVLYDSGWTAGTADSYAVPYTLTSLSGYTVQVSCRSAQGAEGSGSVSFLVELPSTAADPEPEVGRVYEIGINGVGYMLADDGPEGADAYQRRVVSLDPPRLATSDTPFAQAVERYTFAAQTDWSGGAGQVTAGRESSRANAFYDSDGVWPFDPGKLSLLPDVALSSHTYAQLATTVVGSTLHVLTGAKQLTPYASVGAPGTAFTVHASAGTVTDVTTDGTYWYACDGSDVYRGVSATAAGGAFSTENASVIGWAAGRLCAGVLGTGATPNIFKTINDSGAVEYTVITLPASWSITGFSGGGGYVWFGAYSGQVGAVYAWQAGSSNSATVAWELPWGEVPRAVFHYQGQVLVRADRNGTPVLYRCVADGAVLTPFLIAELTGSEVGDFTGRGRFVFFSWSEMDGTDSGIGCIDLASGGYAKHLKGSAGGTVSSVEVWQGLLVFAVQGTGVFVESTGRVSSGWAKTSVFDGGSALEKRFDEYTIQTLPLGSGQSVVLDFSIDRGESYAAVAGGTLSGAGLSRITVPFDTTAGSLSTKVTLSGDGSTSPTLTVLQAKLHPLGMADTLVRVRVNCFDEVRNLQGGVIKAGPGAGAARARTLEQLCQTVVSFQDVDWHLTNVTEVFEVIAAETSKTGVYDRSQRGQALGLACTLTLRKVTR